MRGSVVPVAFVFVPDGAPEPVEWLRRYPDAVRMRARMVWPRMSRRSPGAIGQERDSPGVPDAISIADRVPDGVASVPLVDREGRRVLTADGSEIMRPADLPPEFFVDRGLAVQQVPDAHFLAMLAIDLAKFRQGGAWDVQRRNGMFHRDWVRYATIAIGLYGASAGISESAMLEIQNQYARLWSRFGRVPMDPEYPHLPLTNVRNTRLGYELYRSRRIVGSEPAVGR